MDAFTTVVEPVAMASMTRDDTRKRQVAYKRNAKKREKEKEFREQFAAIYIPTENITPIPPPTYARPVRKFYA